MIKQLQRARDLNVKLQDIIQSWPDDNNLEAQQSELLSLGDELIELCAVLLPEIKKLPDLQERFVLVSFYCNGQSIEDIARRMELTSFQVNLIKQSAVKRLAANDNG